MHSITVPAALAAVLLFSPGWATAQPGPGAARGPAASAPGPAAGGAAARRGMGPRIGPDHTPGWGMMTPQERDEHRSRMAGAGTVEQCRAARDEHRKAMEERARERGMGPLRRPRHDMCAGLGAATPKGKS